MNYLKFSALLLLLTPFYVSAVDIGCSGTVTWVMADNQFCKDSSGKKQLAFKHSTGAYWFCSGSDAASSLVLAAKMSSSILNVYMDNNNDTETCAIHAHYLNPSYSVIP